MELGIALPISGAWATPDNVATVAREAEQRGFRGLWTFQRLLYPTAFELPAVYRSVLDPVVMLGFAASITSRIRLGLAVVNGPFYAPAVLAKQFVTLDVLSKGRFDAGVGLGWSPDEYAAAGVPMERRGRRLDEWLDCLDVLMTQDPAEFHGEFYDVPRSHVGPLAVQRPRPPVLVGGSADAALRRAGTRGDGWISSSQASLDDVRRSIVAVRDAAEQAGRARDAVRCVVRGVTVPEDAPVEGERRPLHGTLDQLRDDLARYAAAGVDEVFLDLNFDSGRVGRPDGDPALAMELAARVMALGGETF